MARQNAANAMLRVEGGKMSRKIGDKAVCAPTHPILRKETNMNRAFVGGWSLI